MVVTTAAARTLERAWALGAAAALSVAISGCTLGDAPPTLLPYLVHPFVVSNDRLKSEGWKPRHANDEALLLAGSEPEPSILPWLAGAGAVTAGAVLGTWWLTRRRRPRSR